MNTSILSTGTYTNTCSCEYYDPETDEYYNTPDCYGDCWDNAVQDFTNITEHLFTEGSQPFSIKGFPTWRGPVNGMFTASNGEELLRSITPEHAEWRMNVTVHADRIVARLFHHDAPMGGTMTVTPEVPFLSVRDETF